MLQNLGYQVVVCADGKQALDLFRENPDRIDLLVMEVVMPALSGPQAYLEMCVLKAGTRVIFTTGYTPKPAELASMMEKGAPLLRKPYSLSALAKSFVACWRNRKSQRRKCWRFIEEMNTYLNHRDPPHKKYRSQRAFGLGNSSIVNIGLLLGCARLFRPVFDGLHYSPRVSSHTSDRV